MERTFKTLFQLSMKHGYYDNELSNDFQFVPSSRTSKDIKSFRLTSKKFNASPNGLGANGLITMYTQVDGAPLITIAPGSAPKGVYGMYLINDQFYNFTDEISNLESGEIFYFTNVGSVESSGVFPLVRSQHYLKRKSFPYRFNIVDSYPLTATVKILDSAGAELSKYEQTLESANGDFEALINLEGVEDGRYQVQVSTAGSGIIQTDQYYLSDEFALNRPFAILDIVVNDNTSLSEKQLQIEFTPREELWKYFIVFKEPLVGGEVIEVGSLAGTTFSEVTSFVGPSRVEDLATKESLEERYPGSEVRLFESDATIEFSESPEKSIKLKKDSVALINNMPSPSVTSPKAEAYILI